MDDVDDPAAFAFDFFEVVVVDDRGADTFGCEATVLGRAIGDDSVPYYGVWLDSANEVWTFAESRLRRTGRKRRREDLISDGVVHISLDGDVLS